MEALAASEPCLTRDEMVFQRARSFHQERTREIQGDDASFPVDEGGLLILHIVPDQMILTLTEYSAERLRESGSHIMPLGHSGGTSRYNALGYATFSGNRRSRGSYSQILRNGAFEGVAGDITYKQYEATLLRIGNCEKALVHGFGEYARFAANLEIPPPFWGFSTIVGVKDVKIRTDYDDGECGFDQEVIHLPAVRLSDPNATIYPLVRPLCDVIWNAGGYPKSPQFDQNGNWFPR